MPILKQSKKRVKQTRVKQARNYNVRTAVKKSIRNLDDSVKAGDKAEAEKNLSVTYKVIDTAVKKNIMQKNTAARRKSMLSKKVAGIKKSPAKAKAPKAEA